MMFQLKTDKQKLIEYLGNVAEKTQIEVDSKIPTISRSTKREVKSRLNASYGINEGIYRNSFKINNFAESKWHVGFQVFAKKPHYRLTHLLEGGDAPMYGHRTILFRWGEGRPTHRTGSVGMSHVYQTHNHYKGHTHIIGYTNSIKHIEPGQAYAENKVVAMYEKALSKSLERIKK